jgi:hypothetical protein
MALWNHWPTIFERGPKAIITIYFDRTHILNVARPDYLLLAAARRRCGRRGSQPSSYGGPRLVAKQADDGCRSAHRLSKRIDVPRV